MMKKNIIFVPGKSPKPVAEQHKNMLWRTLLEGVLRANPKISHDMKLHKSNFYIVAWNFSYYQYSRDTVQDLSSIETLLNQHGPSKEDIDEAKSWRVTINRLLYMVADVLPWIIHWLPDTAKDTIDETSAYFENHGNIGYQIRGMLKTILRPMLANNEDILIIGHSLGSVIAYDTLWELSHNEVHSGKVDFLSLGSPLGLRFVQNKLQGSRYPKKNQYPRNIRHWINLSSVGDVTAVDRRFNDDFSDMLKFGFVESIEDHCDGIYNFYHDERGLNSHSSYGYLVNVEVGKIISDWWQGVPKED